MIGLFDSGYGGLTILKALMEKMPELDYVYLGDNARVPYGSRDAEEIFQFTLQGVEELFRRGCPLVILACNTSSANALRRIQQEVLPVKYPNKRVLGILVPTVEMFADEIVGVLATEATVASEAYIHEAIRRAPGATIIQQACPDLVPLIEAGASDEIIRQTAKRYIDELLARRGAGTPPISIKKINAVLLGCTHYELIAPIIAELLPSGVGLYQQSGIVANSLKIYLARHLEVSHLVTADQDGSKSRTFLTTGDAQAVSQLGSKFFGSPIQFTSIHLS